MGAMKLGLACYLIVLACSLLFVSCTTWTGVKSYNTEIAASSPSTELEVLQTPEGVDTELFEQLKRELARILGNNEIDRDVSTPPLGEESGAILSWNGDASSLEWYYCSIGDYDQNSEVNAADLTPLAIHFKESALPGEFLYKAVQDVIDGDGNNELNIADVTPIALNFRNSVTAYNIYCSANIEDYPASAVSGNGAAQLVATVGFDQGTVPSGERMQFSYLLSSPQSDCYYWVRPTDGVAEGIASSYFYMPQPGNNPPIAVIVPSETVGDIPMLVEFDASGSIDNDGEIVKFEWDWDGAANGWVWEDSGTNAIQQHDFTEINSYEVTVRVTDDGDAKDTASVQIHATAPGNDPPVAVLTAIPESGEIPLTINFNALQSSDIDGMVVDYEWDLDGDGVFNEPGNEDDARGTGLASFTYDTVGVYVGKVRVTDNEGAQDEVTKSIDAYRTPTGEWVQVILDTADEAGDTKFGAISLSLIDGKPAISYGTIFGELKRLKYVSSPTANGVDSAWWLDPVVVDTVDSNQFYTQLVEVDGHPAIAYFPDEVAYVRSDSPSGSNAEDWGSPLILNSDVVGWTYPSLEIVEGNPAMAYAVNDGTSEDGGTLVYHRSTTATGSNLGDWSEFTTITHCDYATTPSLLVVAGNPAITFHHWGMPGDPADSSWKYVRATLSSPASASDWGTPVRISDSEFYAGLASFACVVNNNPAIIYYAGSWGVDDRMYYTRSTTSTGENPGDWNQRVALASGENPTSFDLEVVDGSPAIAYRTFGGSVTNAARFVQAVDGAGSPGNWGVPHSIDQGVPDDRFSAVSMTVINGNPAIAYGKYDSAIEQTNLFYVYLDL